MKDLCYNPKKTCLFIRRSIKFSTSTRLTTQMLLSPLWVPTLFKNNTLIVEHRDYDWHIIYFVFKYLWLWLKTNNYILKHLNTSAYIISIMMVNYSTYWEYYNYFFPIKILLGLIDWSIIIHSWSKKLGDLMHHTFVSKIKTYLVLSGYAEFYLYWAGRA
jgi:hypothetical protein